jgi:hypothetical protein
MGKLVVTERYKIKKYDGEYTEGAKPVETVEIEVQNGVVTNITTSKEKE